MDLIKNALINDVMNTHCSDPFGCLGLQESSSKIGFSLIVWQPEAVSIRVLAIDADKELAQMRQANSKGLFFAEWPKAKERFHYRLEITYKDNRVLTIVDSYQFPNTTFVDPDHHQASLYKSQGAIRASAKVNDQLAIQGTRFAVYAPAARSICRCLPALFCRFTILFFTIEYFNGSHNFTE